MQCVICILLVTSQTGVFIEVLHKNFLLIYLGVCVCVYVYVRVCVCVCMYVYMCVCVGGGY